MATVFTYKVIDKSGKLTTGELEGDNRDLVTSKLRQMGYTIVELKQKAASLNISFGEKKKVSTKDLMIFSRQLAMMIDSGLPIMRALSILSEQTENKYFAKIVTDVKNEVSSGVTISEALSKHPTVFSSLFINMVKSGEIGGILDKVLLRLATVMEKDNELRGKVKSAMAYPTVILVFALIVVTGMIWFIVPVFAGMFSQLGGKLPALTQLLVDANYVISTYWWIIFPSIFGTVFGVKSYKKTENGRKVFDQLMLKIMIVGPLIQKVAISRFTRTLGTLVSSGIPIIQAIEITAKASGNYVVEQALENVKNSVKEGETISKPLANSPIFPPMVVQMISVGEETGALDAMLEKIADFYDTEVDAAVDTLTSMIEPLVMVVLGGAVGVILLGLYMPLFTLMNLIK
jgi:type IV pilus assembly protein PilC